MLPRKLGVTAETYTKDSFFGDVKPLTRFMAPGFNKLVKGSGPQTGLPHLQRLQKAITAGESLTPQALMLAAYEARIFGCAFIHRYTRRSRKMKQFLGKKQPRDRVQATPKQRRRFGSAMTEIEECYQDLAAFRQIVRHLEGNKENFGATSVRIFREVDEYCSYRIRDTLLGLKVLLVDYQGEETKLIADLDAKISATLEAEHRHAVDQSYQWPLATDAQINFERFGRLRSYLKQSLWSVLFLDLRSKATLRIQRNLGAMIAAGFAAAWALSAQLLMIKNADQIDLGPGGMSVSSLGLSGFLFMTAFILAYVVKDRIKEIGRARFRHGVMGRLPDTNDAVWYAGALGKRKNVGTFREWVRFCEIKDLPADARQLVQTQDACTVLHYKKELQLDRKACHTALPYSVRGVHDILRFNTHHLMTFVSESDGEALAPDAEGNVHRVHIPKTYEIQLVVSREVPAGDVGRHDVEGLRLIFSRQGLLRFERL